VYTNADNGVGTGAWTKVTQAASAVVTTASDIAACFTLYTTTVPDTYKYVKCTQSAPGDSGVIVAILHDLAVQRTPANLQIVAA
jgi:precorrin-3B methylase